MVRNVLVGDMIENFRQAAGIANVYRSATTDVLGETGGSKRGFSEKFAAETPGLILDLRSKNEINIPKAQKWMTEQGIHLIDSDMSESFNATDRRRHVVRINVLYVPRLIDFVDKEWIEASEQDKAAALQKGGSARDQVMFRMEKLNERGLLGLNQIILESGGVELCRALKIITQRLEVVPDDVILIHCVQGKDRCVFRLFGHDQYTGRVIAETCCVLITATLSPPD